MYGVSEEYKVQTKQTVRNYSYIKIKFGIIDPDAQSAAQLSTSEGVSYSMIPDKLDTTPVSKRYGTLEPGFWLLDGKSNTFPTVAGYQGFVGKEVSDVAGDLDSPATVTVDFATGYYAFLGLQIKFDTTRDTYPESVTIKTYRDNVLKDTQVFPVTSAVFNINSHIPSVVDTFINKMVLEVENTRIPENRVRIEAVTLGAVKIIDDSTLTDSSWERSNDLMNTVAPIDDFTFTFYDTAREYNPEDPEGIWAYLDKGQQIDVQYGYELNDGSIEWIPGTRHYTEGTPNIDDSGFLSQVTFKAISRLEQLTDNYDEGVYSATGTTLYNLAKAVLEFAGVSNSLGEPEYILSESLKTYSTSAPVPVLPIKDALQLIANAGMCLLYVNRDNKIVFADRSTTIDSFIFDAASVFDSKPSIKKYPYLKALFTYVHGYSVSSSVSELGKIDVSGAINTYYSIEYNMATEVAITVPDTLTINQTISIGAYCTKLIVTGTGTITVKGKQIDELNYTLKGTYNDTGEDCTLDNALVTSKDHCKAFNLWLADILVRRNQYSFSDRGFVETDIADNVHVDTSYVDNREATITKSTITYNGALRGETEVLGI